MRDTCEIHVSARGIKIHAGYIRDPCRIHLSSEAITIHTRYIRDSCAEYMRNTCGIHAGYAYLGCQGECIDVIIMCSAPIRPPIASLCANGSSPAPLSCPAPSSALSWQPLSNPYPCWSLVYHLGRGRSAPPFPDLDVYPDVSHMYLTCIVNVSCVPCILNVGYIVS